MKLLRLDIELNSVIIGERIKGGVYRPCIETIPSTTVKGAFKSVLGIDMIGVGILERGTYKIVDITYSVKDKYLGTSKMPIFASCLFPVQDKIKANIYLAENNVLDTYNFNYLKFSLGALKSKGFGKARVINLNKIDSEIKQGILNVRVLIEDCRALGITPISPVYGYLFSPANFVSGVYKKALFEGSLVKAPEVFLKEVTYYDE